MDTIKNFLLKIDGFLLKYWKLPTFLYFVGALWFCLENGIITDEFIRIETGGIQTSPMIGVGTAGKTWTNVYPFSVEFTYTIEFILKLFSPVIMIYAWKRIFHPKD